MVITLILSLAVTVTPPATKTTTKKPRARVR